MDFGDLSKEQLNKILKGVVDPSLMNQVDPNNLDKGCNAALQALCQQPQTGRGGR